MARGIPLLVARLKHGACVAVAHALYHSGLLRVLQTILLRQRAVVLTYHRVLTEEQRRETGSNPGIVVTRDTFARHMAVLKRRFTVLSVEEFADRMHRRVPFPNSSCLITFDDGWLDNFDNALPILRAQGLPALIFLPVNFVGTDRVFWRETLTLLLVKVLAEVRRDPSRRPAFHAILDRSGLAAVLELPDEDPREALSDALDPLKGVAPAMTTETLIGPLSAELGVNVADLAATDRFMDWTQVQTMAHQGIAFGGHGAEHRLLSQVSDDEADAELAKSKAVITERTKPLVPTFSYPSGSWTPAIVEKAQRSGFQLAFTTDAGAVGAADDPFTLRRVNIHEDATRTAPMLLARILGLF